MNPGTQEDRQNQCFIGPSGRILTEIYLGKPGFPAHAHVYLTNAAKCASPGTNPLRRHYTACAPNLLVDLQLIKRAHPRAAIHVLALGADPLISLWRLLVPGKPPRLSKAFSSQGIVSSTGVSGLRLWSTYHPAAILRDQSRIHAVSGHLVLLLRDITERRVLRTNPDIVPPFPPPSRP